MASEPHEHVIVDGATPCIKCGAPKDHAVHIVALGHSYASEPGSVSGERTAPAQRQNQDGRAFCCLECQQRNNPACNNRYHFDRVAEPVVSGEGQKCELCLGSKEIAVSSESVMACPKCQKCKYGCTQEVYCVSCKIHTPRKLESVSGEGGERSPDIYELARKIVLAAYAAFNEAILHESPVFRFAERDIEPLILSTLQKQRAMDSAVVAQGQKCSTDSIMKRVMWCTTHDCNFSECLKRVVGSPARSVETQWDEFAKTLNASPSSHMFTRKELAIKFGNWLLSRSRIAQTAEEWCKQHGLEDDPLLRPSWKQVFQYMEAYALALLGSLPTQPQPNGRICSKCQQPILDDQIFTHGWAWMHRECPALLSKVCQDCGDTLSGVKNSHNCKGDWPLSPQKVPCGVEKTPVVRHESASMEERPTAGIPFKLPLEADEDESSDDILDATGESVIFLYSNPGDPKTIPQRDYVIAAVNSYATDFSLPSPAPQPHPLAGAFAWNDARKEHSQALAHSAYLSGNAMPTPSPQPECNCIAMALSGNGPMMQDCPNPKCQYYRGLPDCKFSIGQRVFWQGQIGECSGIVLEITKPENSGYVLKLDIGDGAEMFHLESGVESGPSLPSSGPRPETWPQHCDLCNTDMESADDRTEWHGLGNCVPVCMVCMGSGIEPAKPAASPAEGPTQDTLAALKAVQDLFTNDSPFYIKKLGSPITNADQERIDHVFIKVGAAIKEAGKRAAEGPKPGPRCPKCGSGVTWFITAKDYMPIVRCLSECDAMFPIKELSDFAQFFPARAEGDAK